MLYLPLKYHEHHYLKFSEVMNTHMNDLKKYRVSSIYTVVVCGKLVPIKTMSNTSNSYRNSSYALDSDISIQIFHLLESHRHWEVGNSLWGRPDVQNAQCSSISRLRPLQVNGQQPLHYNKEKQHCRFPKCPLRFCFLGDSFHPGEENVGTN